MALKRPSGQNILTGYPGHTNVPLYIKDDKTAALVAQLAQLHGLSKQDAVRMAVEAALHKAAEQIPVEARLRRLWSENPLPALTGKRANKAFFDDLSGGL
jgi:antitoxin VapB